MPDLLRAIEDRRDRAIGVRSDYDVVYVGSFTWVVMHPDDEGRCYAVDMVERRCNCPDFACTASGLEIDCKHIGAVVPEYERMTGRRYMPKPAGEGMFIHQGKRTNDAGFIAVVDPDGDPFETLPY